jgi:hypothetical protein
VYDLTVEPVKNARGEITEITGAAMDITEHKRLEKKSFKSETAPETNDEDETQTLQRNKQNVIHSRHGRGQPPNY